jgi:hypothetical protein
LLLQNTFSAGFAVLTYCLCATIAAAEVPAPGCYARVYDAAHLAAHPGQLVMWITVLVKQPDAAEAAALGASRAARADLRIWMKGKRKLRFPWRVPGSQRRTELRGIRLGRRSG